MSALVEWVQSSADWRRREQTVAAAHGHVASVEAVANLRLCEDAALLFREAYDREWCRQPIDDRDAHAELLQHTGLMATKRNVHEALDQIEQLWSPHVVAEVNDYDVKVAKVAGEFAEHVHDDTDEVFLVLAGRLHLDLPDETVTLDPMDLYTVPRGMRHRPRADAGTRILMLEPRGTSQDGTPTGSTGVRLT